MNKIIAIFPKLKCIGSSDIESITSDIEIIEGSSGSENSLQSNEFPPLIGQITKVKLLDKKMVFFIKPPNGAKALKMVCENLLCPATQETFKEVWNNGDMLFFFQTKDEKGITRIWWTTNLRAAKKNTYKIDVQCIKSVSNKYLIAKEPIDQYQDELIARRPRQIDIEPVDPAILAITRRNILVAGGTSICTLSGFMVGAMMTDGMASDRAAAGGIGASIGFGASLIGCAVVYIRSRYAR